MDFAYIIILSFVSLAVLFIITKIMGFRQISEMSFFDYVIGITIGSIAAEMATNIDLEWWKGILAMVVYGVVGVLLSVLAQKSVKARKFISGKPIIIIERGKISKEGMRKARVELDDLLTSARVNGYFNLSDIDYAIMETTGKISFQPVAQKRQLNPKDFNFAPEREGLYINVIMDGHIIDDNLSVAGVTKKELDNMLKAKGDKLENIFLGTVDINKQLTTYLK
ncbi:MAG: DUF421 domain-containing protein [Eubacterium sp.]|nr:DUF421 domain-containing protein [Eubacterium sp.]